MLADPLSIIMELVKQGSLHDMLQRRALTVDEQFNLCRSVTCGLKTLHDAGILHCDLKGKNILVDDSLLPKITDFGIARVRAQSETLSGSTMLSGVGTYEWMAPELYSSPTFSAGSDTYALGMVFYEITTRQLPWAKELGAQPVVMVPAWTLGGQRPAIPSSVDAGLAAIMRDCWQPKAEDRPSLSSVIARLASESPTAKAEAAAAEAAAAKAAAEAKAAAAAYISLPTGASSAGAPIPAHSRCHRVCCKFFCCIGMFECNCCCSAFINWRAQQEDNAAITWIKYIPPPQPQPEPAQPRKGWFSRS
jgi:serine/threonine protein kinase